MILEWGRSTLIMSYSEKSLSPLSSKAILPVSPLRRTCFFMYLDVDNQKRCQKAYGGLLYERCITQNRLCPSPRRRRNYCNRKELRSSSRILPSRVGLTREDTLNKHVVRLLPWAPLLWWRPTYRLSRMWAASLAACICCRPRAPTGTPGTSKACSVTSQMCPGPVRFSLAASRKITAASSALE